VRVREDGAAGTAGGENSGLAVSGYFAHSVALRNAARILCRSYAPLLLYNSSALFQPLCLPCCCVSCALSGRNLLRSDISSPPTPRCTRRLPSTAIPLPRCLLPPFAMRLENSAVGRGDTARLAARAAAGPPYSRDGCTAISGRGAVPLPLYWRLNALLSTSS